MRNLRFTIYGLRFLIVFAVTIAFSRAVFADPAVDFNAANELYAKGKFVEAAAAYDKIIQNGAVSANALFNYGNAEFKAGNPGKAIAAFRQAELLAPRDAEVRANLSFVRNQLQGGSPPTAASRLNDWLGQLKLHARPLLAAVLYWTVLLLLAAKQFQPKLRSKLRGATAFAVVLVVLTAGAAGFRASEHFSKQTAVVVPPQANALSGPFDDAQIAFLVQAGAELPVVGRHGDWVQVTDHTGKVGWIGKKQVEVLPDA